MERKYKIILAALAIVFFFAYSWLTLTVYLPNAEKGMIFDWPDETANHFFIKNFKNVGTFSAHEQLNDLLANPYVHPRSVNIVENAIVPMSFPGMIMIYGQIAKSIGVFGESGMLFFTPLFGVLAAVLLGMIMRRAFGDIVGIFSAVFCFIVPGFWYYSGMVMLPNVLFLFLLVLGIYCLIWAFLSDEARRGQEPDANVVEDSKLARRREKIVSGISGFCFGLALITRPTEIVWVAFVLLILAIAYWREVKNRWTLLIIFFVGGALPMLSMLFFNYEVYGKYLTFGYLRQNQPTFSSGLPTEFQTSDGSIIGLFKLLVVPFGINLRYAWSIFYEYAVKLHWPFFVSVIGAVIWMFVSKKTKGEKVLLAMGVAVCGWLAFFYGNWVLEDKLVLQYNRLSSSYVRYFLPMYVFFALATAWVVGKIAQTKLSWRVKIAIICSLVVGLFCFSTYSVVFNKQDGLFAQTRKIEKYHDQRQVVESKIPRDALLIVDRADKIFWPEHKVVIFLGDNGIFPELKKLLPTVPIFYYTGMGELDIGEINVKTLQPIGVEFQDGQKIDENFNLYRLTLY